MPRPTSNFNTTDLSLSLSFSLSVVRNFSQRNVSPNGECPLATRKLWSPERIRSEEKLLSGMVPKISRTAAECLSPREDFENFNIHEPRSFCRRRKNNKVWLHVSLWQSTVVFCSRRIVVMQACPREFCKGDVWHKWGVRCYFSFKACDRRNQSRVQIFYNERIN